MYVMRVNPITSAKWKPEHAHQESGMKDNESSEA